MAALLQANDKYYAELTQDYEVGDSIIYLTNVPDNVPTILVAAKDTVNETVFQITDKTLNSVTGVTRISGANVELLTQTPITCLNNAEFINQFNAKLVPDGGTTGQVLKKKTNSDGDLEWGVGGLTQSQIVDLIYPVGSIYISVTSTNPETLFGGTWVAWGTGQVPVGVDSGQTEFNTVEKTGGAKTHQLSVTEMPAHAHYTTTNNDDFNDVGGSGSTGPSFSRNNDTPNGNYRNTNTNSQGGDGAHNNLQPYITCFMWKRTN